MGSALLPTTLYLSIVCAVSACDGGQWADAQTIIIMVQLWPNYFEILPAEDRTRGIQIIFGAASRKQKHSSALHFSCKRFPLFGGKKTVR